MRKVIVGAFVSMDGVMQAPGGPDEDPTGGFKYGGWVAPMADTDPVFGEEIGGLFGQPYDLLLGRKTYEIFAAHWPYAEGGPDDEIAKQFNRITKYVVTRKPGDIDTSWVNTVVLKDVAKDVSKLKQSDGPALVTQGSTEIVHALLAAGLVDEIRVFTFPVLLGKGKRLFDSSSQAAAYKLTHSKVSPLGLIAATYVPNGEVKHETIRGAENPSKAELARREKMKREG
ncbi:MAG: dihydrofolate reductase family protein [Hyphomonadaceae bacterium]